jgi:hypothetical protein
MLLNTHRGLRDLASGQADVVMREQLLRLGFSQGGIAAEVSARRWRQLNETVIVLHNGPMTQEQREWAVLLSAPAPAALGGLTAASRAGLTGFETDVVHVLVQRGAKLLDLPGVPVKVHESRRFAAEDIFTVNPPYRVSVARAIVDAAVWSRSTQTAARILVAGVQQRLVTTGDLAGELDRAGKVRHRRMLRLLLNDLEGGAQALSEVEFLRFCRRHGLPKPRLNYRTDSAGKRRYLDAVFTRQDGGVVRVEIDGGVHLKLAVRWRDTLRDNDMVLDGKAPLRFVSAAIYADDPVAVSQLRRALGTCQTLVEL